MTYIALSIIFSALLLWLYCRLLEFARQTRDAQRAMRGRLAQLESWRERMRGTWDDA